ncbi:YdiK family protein [Lentibacillus halophilus]|uniref:YdiK family protein n=1 Tax=Lentibacillus halophilus TaxID=295065 RepID=A0ABN0Z411_9BACI
MIKMTPKTMAIIYFLIGAMFISVAVQVTGESIWRFPTILLALVATLEFGVGIRMLIIHFKIKSQKKKK